MASLGWVRRCLLVWVGSCGLALGQSAPDASVVAALRSLASRSGVVFAGRVTQVRQVGVVVEVDFKVEETLLGSVGPMYTLREWAGLWAAGQERYGVGERVVIFLHAPGKAGLSSPVDGMDGIVPVVRENAESDPLLDVRRLATRVERPMGAAMVDAAYGAMGLSEVKTVVARWREPVSVVPLRRTLPVAYAPVAMARVQPVVLMAGRVR